MTTKLVKIGTWSTESVYLKGKRRVGNHVLFKRRGSGEKWQEGIVTMFCGGETDKTGLITCISLV